MKRIVKASLEHIDDVAPLFDAYRVFYEQNSDLGKAKSFLSERIKLNESVIFIAYLDNKAVGFTQLYPIFSSVSLERSFVLNDLYVNPEIRGSGIGTDLLREAKDLVNQESLKGLALETAKDNPAQKLYEREGWKKEDEYFHYFWKREERGE